MVREMACGFSIVLLFITSRLNAGRTEPPASPPGTGKSFSLKEFRAANRREYKLGDPVAVFNRNVFFA
jgi:hypothetical protein